MEKYKELRKQMKSLYEELRKESGYFLKKMKHLDKDKIEITNKEAKIWNKFIDIMRDINWVLAFDEMKEIKYKENDPIIQNNCGKLVQVRPCSDEYEKKTYLGIYLGDIPLSISHSIDKEGIVTCENNMYNPAIFIFDTKTIVFGCGSWWGFIESEEELKSITDNDIENVWYVKLLNRLNKKEGE